MEYFALKTGAFIPATGTTCPNGVAGVAVPAVDDGTGTLVPYQIPPATQQAGGYTLTNSSPNYTTKLQWILPPATDPRWVNGATYTSPATIPLTASVIPNGHTITKVQFYNSTALIAEAGAASGLPGGSPLARFCF